MDFSGSAGAATQFDLLPAGLLVFVNIEYKGTKKSGSGGSYLDLCLTVDANQPHAGRKIFVMIGVPNDMGNSEAYRQMGTIAITRILEAGRNAGPHNMAGYVIDDYAQIDGLRAAIKVSIEPGTNGHNDKNRVGEWLTPNPASQSGHKGFAKLIAGDHGVAAKTAPPAAQQSGFAGFGGTQPAAQASAQPSGFGSGAVAQPAAQPAASGWGAQATGGASGTSGFPQPAGGAASSAADPSTQQGSAPNAMSPSNPTALPGWLAQANGA
jgi:hypothetical protein